jgi:hypothetical protein
LEMIRRTLSGSEVVDLAATGGVFVYVYDYVYERLRREVGI